MDQPTVDGVNSYVVSKAARESGLTVALSGLGGDELFGGYHTFGLVPRVDRLAGLAGRVPFGGPLLAGALSAWPIGSGTRRLGGAFAGRPSLDRAYGAVRGLFGPEGARTLLRDDLLGAASHRGAVNGRGLHDPIVGDAWDAVSRLELRRYMHDQLLRDTDVMSMAHSLEVRVPLLDRDLVDLVLRLPVEVRAAGGQRKGLLRAAVEDLLPPIVRDRSDKQGFTFPFGIWLKTALAPVLADALDGAATRSEVFRRAAIERLRADYGAGRVHWSRVWAVAVLELWLRRSQEGATDELALAGLGRTAPTVDVLSQGATRRS
jgi:asparagine synthase (glutamine-hydrolysing)